MSKNSRKRKIRYDRLAILLIIIILISLGIWGVYSKLSSLPKENVIPTPAEQEEPTTTNKFAVLDYYHEELEERYQAYQEAHPEASIENVVTYVNIGIDKPFFSEPVEEITNLDDYTLLVNKMYKLPDTYVPNDLVETSQPCIQGQHYSCFAGGTQYVRPEVNENFKALCDQAYNEIGISIYAIASFRDYDYQNNLYQYGISSNGQDYADKYYARPGQSEHQSGLAIDVTFDDWNFEELETHPQYQWFLEHLAEHGFILRYPKGKEDITGYQHESWHIRYLGKDLAKRVYDSGLTYEEFIARGLK